MKKLTFALITSAALTGAAQAGSYAEPAVEVPVIVQDATNSSAGAALPLYLAMLTVIAALQ